MPLQERGTPLIQPPLPVRTDLAVTTGLLSACFLGRDYVIGWIISAVAHTSGDWLGFERSL